jgi:hypothetical protein
MTKAPMIRLFCTATLGGGFCLTGPAQAAFLDDSKASLELRNFYMNRDFRQDGAARSKAEEWAQGFLLRYESGFTEGDLGFGVDALGTLGVRLDSGRGRSGTGILQVDRETGDAQDSYGDLGAIAKLRWSRNTLKLGTLQPKLPVLLANDSRLLPQVFQGGQLTSTQFDGLTLDAGQFHRVNQRDSSDNERMTITNSRTGATGVPGAGGARGITFNGGATSDRFNFAGGVYQWNEQLSTGYHYGQLDDFYKQHIVSLVHVLPLGAGKLKSDLRYARSSDDGSSNVDNRALGALFTYSQNFHSIGAGYQRMDGDTGFAYVNGADPFLVNFVQIGDFAFKDEQSWQLRYDYDFRGLGIPGLTFMTRYLSGDNVDRGAGLSEGREWERNTDIAYVIQDGPLKNVGLRWRNATTRSNFGNDLDENRLILSYSLSLW